MTAKIQTSQSTSTLLDRVLDSVACCSSAEHAFACFEFDECGPPPRMMRPWGEAVLPHLRFGPLPAAGYGNYDGGGISSSVREFHRLFLADDARYGFELFHTKNGDGHVEVGPWRDVAANNNSGPINIDLDFDIDIMTGGGANYQWALMNAYPVSYQSETLTDDGGDQISEITIDFSYKNWVGSPMKISESPTMIGSAGVNASSVATKAINKIYDILN